MKGIIYLCFNVEYLVGTYSLDIFMNENLQVEEILNEMSI